MDANYLLHFQLIKLSDMLTHKFANHDSAKTLHHYAMFHSRIGHQSVTRKYTFNLRAHDGYIDGSLTLKPYNGGIDTNKNVKRAINYVTTDTKAKESILPVSTTIEDSTLCASDIIKAVIAGKKDIITKFQDPDFRFPSKIGGDLINASDLSEAFAIILGDGRSKIGKQNAAKSVKSRNNKADEYAISLYNQIETMRNECKKMTFRKTIELLEEKEIKTPSGGTNWHISTLQDLKKRWKELGLTSESPKP